MSIPFTQFLLPNGERRAVTVDTTPELEAIAHELIANGCRFEIELLRSGEIYMDCQIGEELLANQLCPNDKNTLITLEKLIHSAKVTYDG